MRVKVHFVLEMGADLGLKKIWQPNSEKYVRKCPKKAAKFFLRPKSKIAPLSTKCTFTRILKISGENIEKCRRRSNLSEAHF